MIADTTLQELVERGKVLWHEVPPTWGDPTLRKYLIETRSGADPIDPEPLWDELRALIRDLTLLDPAFRKKFHKIMKETNVSFDHLEVKPLHREAYKLY